MSSEPHERYIAITVKEERYISGKTKYPPLLSPLLVRRTPPGTRMMITGFTGPYTLNARILEKTNHLFHICAGSGSVPNFSIIKSALKLHPELRHTLLYSNRTWEDVIFRSEIEALAQAHPDQLKVIHTLTREAHPETWAFRRSSTVTSSSADQAFQPSSVLPRRQKASNQPPASWSRCSLIWEHSESSVSRLRANRTARRRECERTVAAVNSLRLRAIALALRGPPAMSQVAGLSAVIDRRFSDNLIGYARTIIWDTAQ